MSDQMNIENTGFFSYVPTRLALGGFVSLVAGYFVYFAWWLGLPPTKDSGVWGSFGDFLGGVLNPLIAIAVLYYVVRTFEFQKEELKLTRQELKDTRLEHEKQTRELMKQSLEREKVTKIQRNEVLIKWLEKEIGEKNQSKLEPRSDTTEIQGHIDYINNRINELKAEISSL
ncbi:hypothetical protein [Paremcibacter congregatus]|nr:hypothetical protein [Paremcibacter congregatus]QDE26082.1 hypothetical protein FIV45_01675 [Paremcibacter congregatus]